ncbi:hypothetical protein ABET52_14910 [Saccharococcus caldoxylosilyticus]|uniref:hypothetical protein n=1 Tax=Saccharococcus caldoxylosilyticus TaxID=81408 RepID=UPI003D33966B
MKEQIIALLNTYENAAYLISIVINIIISILGLVPSVFLTAANLAVFGFWKGTFLSFAGQAFKAIVSLMNLGFYKESDFHYMAVGYKGHTIYVVNQEENKTLGQGGFYSKDDGKTWLQSQLNGLPQTAAGTIAAHPTDACTYQTIIRFKTEGRDIFGRILGICC